MSDDFTINEGRTLRLSITKMIRTDGTLVDLTATGTKVVAMLRRNPTDASPLLTKANVAGGGSIQQVNVPSSASIVVTLLEGADWTTVALTQTTKLYYEVVVQEPDNTESTVAEGIVTARIGATDPVA